MRLKFQQWMVKYLRKRNWVVFYLRPEYRECKDSCWLKSYEYETKGE